MTLPIDVSRENRATRGFMKKGTGQQPSADAGETLAFVPSGAGFLAVAATLVAASAVALGLLAAGTTQPVLLTIMAVLAMLGVFFLLATAAGHIRLSERVTDADLVKGIAARLENGVLITNRHGATLYANEAWSSLADAGASGAVNGFEHLVSGSSESTEGLFRLNRAATQRESRSEILQIGDSSDPAGGARWIRLSVRPLDVPSLEAQLGPLCLWQMIDLTTERAREADRLTLIESRLSAYDRVPVGLASIKAEGTVAYINGTLAGWAAHPEEIASGTLQLADLVTEEGARLVLEAMADEGAGVEMLDLELCCTGGARLPMRVVCGGRAGDGSFGLAFVEEGAQRALGASADGRTTELRFAHLFQSAPFGIATMAADGHIVSANSAFTRMLFERKSVEGRHVAALLGGEGAADLREAAEAAIAAVISGQGNLAPMEVSVGPQSEYARRLYMSPIAHAAGGREAAVLFLIDATEQKALELKFAQSQKMEAVGKLAGGIAHDFNNVLTAIIGFSDLLLQTHRPTDAAYKDIMNIRSSANRAAAMVRQLLAFSRRQTLQTETLQLGEVVTDLSALLNRAIGEMIELKIISGRDLWMVKADKSQFEQVIINLAVNARDAMPEGGRLTIRTRNVSERESARLNVDGLVAAEYVLVEVEDTGVGMTADVVAKIFEPFFTTKGVGKGTGLGLATVYGIVKQTGGYVYTDSTPGKGTVFRVYLPRFAADELAGVEDEPEAQKAAKKERPGDLTGSGRVLLVEDEDVVRSFAMRALKRQGYEVLEASTGVEALEVMAQNQGRVDIVVSDVVMPEMDGPTLLKELRKTNPDLKIIFVSGYPDDAFKKSLDENETFAFLPKPFSLPQLAAKVKEQLGR